MARFGGAHPGRVVEADTAELHVPHGAVHRPGPRQEGFQAGDNDFVPDRVLTLSRPVNDAPRNRVLMPLSGLIDELDRSGQKERGAVRLHDGLRPWMFELQAALRVLKPDPGLFSLNLHGSKAKVRDLPHLEDRHLHALQGSERARQFRRNPRLLLLAIPVNES